MSKPVSSANSRAEAGSANGRAEAGSPSKLDFEQALAELEKIVARMESGELSLEQALATHKRGLELGERERLAGRLEVDLLAARHAARAGGKRQDRQHFQLRPGRLRKLVLGHQLESERLQRVADEQRRRLVVFDVHGRLAAPQDVVVHARHVVVHQRIGMDHLHRGGGDLQPLRGRARELPRRKRQ